MTEASRPPALLCDASFYGTLAAVRSLGRAGIVVRVADSIQMGPAHWSRYTRDRLRCPPVAEAERFLEWLLRLGERDGRHVLYPTSDELAFLLSTHREALSRSFALYQPDLRTEMRILDKRQLLEAAREAGVASPPTWFVESAGDVERAVREASGPLMVKPRTQLFLRHHGKGAVLPRDPVEAVRAFDRWRRANVYRDPIARESPELTCPMLQHYYPDAAQWIYSLSGFRDRSGEHLVLRGAVKVLQRPRTFGVGLCFEAALVEPELARGVSRLLEAIGYHGVFEIEFVREGDQMLLIDMNPRFYNQLAFDVARGLDLPLLAYSAAQGDEDEVARLATASTRASGPDAFCNRVGLGFQVSAQELFGRLTAEEAAVWRKWARDRNVVDSTAAADDPGPLVVDMLSQAYAALRHPRAFLRMIAFDR